MSGSRESFGVRFVDWFWTRLGRCAGKRCWWRLQNYAYNRNVDRWLSRYGR